MNLSEKKNCIFIFSNLILVFPLTVKVDTNYISINSMYDFVINYHQQKLQVFAYITVVADTSKYY